MFNRNDLLEKFSILKDGTNTTSMEGFSCFFFSGEKIISYNDEISIQLPFKTTYSALIKAKDLCNLLEKLSLQTIVMNEVKGKLNIKCKSTSANFVKIEDKETLAKINKLEEIVPNIKWKKLPENFCSKSVMCAFAASKAESEFTLSCVYVKDNECWACDNRRIAKSVMSGKMEEVLIPAKFIKSITDINPYAYAISKAWIHFKNKDGVILSARNVKGEYPDMSQLIEFEGDAVEFSESIFEGIDVTSIFVDVVTPIITISLKNKVCLITVKSESGNVAFRTDVDYIGEDIKFNIDPEYLKEMIKYKPLITLGDSKLKIEVDGFSLVTALIRRN